MEIRKHREFDRMPVIMYTSLMTDKMVEDCFRGGANLYLAKTPSFAALKEKLGKIFKIDWESHLHFPPLDQFVC
jgi:PleD family two-component response regulator